MPISYGYESKLEIGQTITIESGIQLGSFGKLSEIHFLTSQSESLSLLSGHSEPFEIICETQTESITAPGVDPQNYVFTFQNRMNSCHEEIKIINFSIDDDGSLQVVNTESTPTINTQINDQLSCDAEECDPEECVATTDTVIALGQGLNTISITSQDVCGEQIGGTYCYNVTYTSSCRQSACEQGGGVWLPDASEEDDGSGNFCCGGTNNAQCGRIQTVGETTYLCDGSDWIEASNTPDGRDAIGDIQEITCEDHTFNVVAATPTEWYGCSDDPTQLFFQSGGNNLSLGDTLSITTDKNSPGGNSETHDYYCSATNFESMNIYECAGLNLHPFSTLSGSFVGPGTWFSKEYRNENNPSICYANASIGPMHENLDESTCIGLRSNTGAVWGGNKCCIQWIGNSFVDSLSGCYLGIPTSILVNSKPLYESNQNLIKKDFFGNQQVLMKDKAFYGCGYDLFDFNDYERDLGFPIDYDANPNIRNGYATSYNDGDLIIIVQEFENDDLTSAYVNQFTDTYTFTQYGKETEITIPRYENIVTIRGTGRQSTKIIDFTFQDEISEPIIQWFYEHQDFIFVNVSDSDLTLRVMRFPSIHSGEEIDSLASSIDETEFIPRIDEGENAVLCENIGDYHCSSFDRWRNKRETTLYSEEDEVIINQSSTTAWETQVVPGKRPTGCCKLGDCWNGEGCITNQDGLAFDEQDLSGPPGEKIYACINGSWESSEIHTDWMGETGYCPSTTQCFVASETISPYDFEGAPGGCFEDTTWIEDHFCDGGDWRSRTSITAEILSGFVNETDEFSLFCDDYETTLNYLDHNIGNYLAEDLLKGSNAGTQPCLSDGLGLDPNGLIHNTDCINNACVLRINPESNGEEIYLGTSHNFLALPNQPNNLLSVVPPGEHYKGNDQEQNIIQKSLTSSELISDAGLFIYKYDQTPSTSQPELLDIFKNMLTFIFDVFYTPEQANIEIESTFDRLYLAETTNNKAFRMFTYSDIGKDQDFFVGNIDCFKKNICPSLQQDHPEIDCTYDNYKTALNRTVPLLGNPLSDELWLDLTGKIRIQDDGPIEDALPEGTFTISPSFGHVSDYSGTVQNHTALASRCVGEDISVDYNFGNGWTQDTSFNFTNTAPEIKTIQMRLSVERDGQTVENIIEGYAYAFDDPEATVAVQDKTTFSLGEMVAIDITCEPSNPQSESSLTSCELFTLSDPDNPLAVGTITLGESHSSTHNIENLPQGSHDLQVVATENHGYTGRSSIVTIHVGDPKITCDADDEQGQFLVALSGTTNAHASKDTDNSNYPIRVYCEASRGILNEDTSVAWLHANTNAHTSDSQSNNYGEALNLGWESTNENEVYSFVTRPSGCLTDESCIIKISSESNAHLSTCNVANNYQSICMRFG